MQINLKNIGSKMKRVYCKEMSQMKIKIRSVYLNKVHIKRRGAQSKSLYKRQPINHYQ